MSLIDIMVEDEPTLPAVQNIVKAGIRALGSGDGFTIDPVTGNAYTGHWWTVGGIVPSLTLDSSWSVAEFQRQVTEWYEVTTILTDQPYVGGWVHDGVLYLDLVTLVKDEEQAVMLGRMWSQIAIGRIDDDDEFVTQFID